MKIIFLVLFSFSSYAYRPTLESLFRNNSNAEFEQPTTNMGFLVRKQDEKEGFYTSIAITENPSGNEIYQVYKQSKETANVIMLKEIPRVDSLLTEAPEKALFYSLMGMILRNNSELIITTLKRKGLDVAFNREAENRSKKVLLEKYRSFLEKKRLDPEYSDENSPLNSESEEEKKKIMDLYNESYYAGAEKAQMVKEGSFIYWKVIKDGFEALFHSGTRRLHRITYTNDDKVFEMSFSQYFKIDGIHEVPKYISVKYNDEIYVLEAKDYKEYKLNEFQKKKAAEKGLVGESSSLSVPAFFIQ